MMYVFIYLHVLLLIKRHCVFFPYKIYIIYCPILFYEWKFSSQVSLYFLIETVLGPVWVYLAGYGDDSIGRKYISS